MATAAMMAGVAVSGRRPWKLLSVITRKIGSPVTTLWTLSIMMILGGLWTVMMRNGNGGLRAYSMNMKSAIECPNLGRFSCVAIFVP
ncbi:hypothetical protein Tsubulata_018991 [Turnera subulata]|uniref:Uncharacterized protein n=1 Tax=Turnera subulata TaxID=218843 RepID=A0A9Q0JQS2_9ROSI|nr:hypothetical protein Tsubulata_018991 [Turnera subulata]